MSKIEVLALILAVVVLLSHVAAPQRIEAILRDRLRRYGALERVSEDNIYPTVGTAVSAYVRASGEPWTDWEEDARVDVQPATEPPEPPR